MNKQLSTINGQLDNNNLEIELLIEAIYLKYGYDFRNYARASLRRRINHRFSLSGLENISEMIHKVINDSSFFERLLVDCSINVTEMFRDPDFYLALRKEILPQLGNYPFIKIWHAGCASGEEVYSMAILLQETNLYQKTQIYATDFNEVVLKQAKDGMFPINRIKEYSLNYQKSGGTGSLSDYYIAKYGSIIMDSSLKKHIVFADHNLVTDWGFSEMHLILCRNVLIYFDRELQDRVLNLFMESLCEGGFLCLGNKESVRTSKYSNYFEDAVPGQKIYRKKNV